MKGTIKTFKQNSQYAKILEGYKKKKLLEKCRTLDISYMIDIFILKDGNRIEEDLSDLSLIEKKKLLLLLDLVPFSPEFTHLYENYNDDVEKATFKLDGSRVYFDYPIYVKDCLGCLSKTIECGIKEMNMSSNAFYFYSDIEEWERIDWENHTEEIGAFLYPKDECDKCKKVKI